MVIFIFLTISFPLFCILEHYIRMLVGGSRAPMFFHSFLTPRSLLQALNFFPPSLEPTEIYLPYSLIGVIEMGSHFNELCLSWKCLIYFTFMVLFVFLCTFKNLSTQEEWTCKLRPNLWKKNMWIKGKQWCTDFTLCTVYMHSIYLFIFLS